MFPPRNLVLKKQYYVFKCFNFNVYALFGVREKSRLLKLDKASPELILGYCMQYVQ